MAGGLGMADVLNAKLKKAAPAGSPAPQRSTSGADDTAAGGGAMKVATARTTSASAAPAPKKAGAVAACKQCGCNDFKANAFKKGCATCFHEH